MRYLWNLVFFLMLPGVAFGQTERHPSLLCSADALPGIHARLGREPYAGWRARLLAEANAILARKVDWNGTAVRKPVQAYYAKTLAGAYAFAPEDDPNRRAYAEDAVRGLIAVPVAGFKTHFVSDLEISEAAAFWAVAYDLLAGHGFDFLVDGVDREPAVRAALSGLRGYMATYPVAGIFPPSSGIGADFSTAALYISFMTRADNHHVKLLGALCLLSLAIYDEPGAASDFSAARSRFLQTLDNLTVTDGNLPAGGWAEGPNYHLYTMGEYLPALTALQNQDLFKYTDFPEFETTHLILPRMVMPDGWMPPVDSNEACVFHLAPILASRHGNRPDAAGLLWLWERNGRPVNQVFLSEFLTQFDDTLPTPADPEALGWPRSESRYGAGFAVLRDSWGPESIYFLLLAEHGEARIKGQAHEHPDPNAILIHAFGELLLLDSGYGGFANKDATRFAVNHNIILVDGKGPTGASQQFGSSGFWNANGSDAFLERFFTTDRFDFVSSRTDYEETRFTRHVLFADHRYFLLFDRVANSFGPRTYTLLLHGNGGGSSGGTFSLQTNEARWNRPKASLHAFCAGTNDLTLGPAALSFDTIDLFHAVYQRAPFLSHTVLRASQRGIGARFLTLLRPGKAGDPAPDPQTLAVSPETGGTGIRIADGDTADVCAVRQRGGVLSFAANGNTLNMDAELAWCRVLPDGSPERCFILNGTSLADSRGVIVSLSGAGYLFADFRGPGRISGHVLAGAGTTVSIRGPEPIRVRFRGSEIGFTPGDGVFSFTVTGDGAWEAETLLQPPSGVRVEDIPGDQGHSLRVFWLPSPSETGGLVDRYRIFRSRQDEFTMPIPLSQFTVIDSLLHYEARYPILIDSVAVGPAEFIDPFVPLNGVPYYYWIQAVGGVGVSKPVSASGLVVGVVGDIPRGFLLGPASPNPFNPSTTIEYTLPREERIVLTVYTVTGQKVAVLADRREHAGTHRVVWDARSMPSGVYLYTLRAGEYSGVGKMTLVK